MYFLIRYIYIPNKGITRCNKINTKFRREFIFVGKSERTRIQLCLKYFI